MNPIANILKFINWPSISIKNKLLALFSFCLIVASLISLGTNLYLGLPMEMNIIVLSITAINGIACYASLRNLFSDKGRYLYLSILVTFLPIGWVYNGGILGAIPMYFFIYFIASILTLSRAYRNYFIAYTVLLTALVLIIQNTYQEIITPYASVELQIKDMKYSFIQVIIILIVMTIAYTSINDNIKLKLIRRKKRLEASYTRLSTVQKQTEEAALAKSNFITNISHEIRTPLTGIVGIAELLQQSTLDEEQKLLVQSLQSSSKTMLDLVNDLLDLSKIEANKLTLNEEHFLIRQTIKEVHDLMSLQLKGKNINLSISAADNVPLYIVLDRSKYKQIIMNLVGNALKFTKEGTVTCTIQYDAIRSTLTSRIEDTGIGIKETDLPGIFTPFTQLNKTDDLCNNGIGMGLVISKKMIEFMGGEIYVSSSLNKGTCFEFILPLISTAQPIAMHPLAEEMNIQKPLHILITEDHKINQVILAKMLGKLAHTYETADNGQQAVDMCKTKSFDVVLLDMQMPILDGIEATKAIVKHFHTIGQPAPKIIGCSANRLHKEDEESTATLMAGFLLKPVTLQQLHAVLSGIQ